MSIESSTVKGSLDSHTAIRRKYGICGRSDARFDFVKMIEY